MIQVQKKSKKENISHKDKERIRHRKQVDLLNNVMKLVPASPQQKRTKVKKLRQLVLYNHFLKMVHEKLTKGLSTATNEGNTCIDTIPKPAEQISKLFKPTKAIYEPKPKRRKAQIIFLHADKSAQEEILSSEAVDKCYNFEESAPSSISEYKVPDVLSSNKSNHIIRNQENCFTSEILNSIKVNEVPLQSFLVNNQNKLHNDARLDKSDKDLFYNEKENDPPISSNAIFMNCNGKNNEISPQKITISNENLVGNYPKDFHSSSQKCGDKCILKESTFSNAVNESFVTSEAEIPVQNGEYFLNSYQIYPFQSISDMYEFRGSPANYAYHAPAVTNNFYFGDYFLNAVSVEPPIYNWTSVAESISDSSHSSTSTDRLFIDEDLLDMNLSYTNLSGSSTSHNLKTNSCDSKNDSLNLPTERSLPINTNIRCNEGKSLYSTKPKFSSSYFENNPAVNEIVFSPVCELPKSYFGNAYPNSMDLSTKSTGNFQSDSPYLLPDVNAHSVVIDHDSFYSPSCDGIQTDEFPMLQSKSESADNFSESSQENSKYLFGEETSYSLAEYFKNC